MSSDLPARLQPNFRTSSTASPQLPTPGTLTGTPSSPLTDRSERRDISYLGKILNPSLSHSLAEEREHAKRLQASKQTHQRRSSRTELSDTHWGSSQETLLEEISPRVTIERPTPERGRSHATAALSSPQTAGRLQRPDGLVNKILRPTIAVRRQSPIPDSPSRLFFTLKSAKASPPRPSYSGYVSQKSTQAKMPHRKVWVKRPGSSATQVQISEDDLVDDVRDMVIRKYANSLGRNFDPPDVTLRIVQRKYSARHSNHERTLSPEEVIFRLLDMYYPGGQTVEEAIVIDVPQRRTPKHSPRISMPYYVSDTLRPGENQTDYFPIMPAGPHSPQVATNFPTGSGPAALHRQNPHAIAVLETGQLPELPSPGSRMTRHSHRPKYGRQHTSSPTVLAGATNNQTSGMLRLNISESHQRRFDSGAEASKIQNTQPLPTPPLPIDTAPQRVATPAPRTSSPRPAKPSRRNRKSPIDNQVSSLSTSTSLLELSVPPINVLVVEDNIINLKLLEAFLKRLKVRWSTAMNGRDAVARWREGGFHLVLMDIQLPIMNGLEATKEIRRLEKINNIGVFTSSAGNTPQGEDCVGDAHNRKLELKEEDRLLNTALFKSSVIIVALTASSLQSDRHEALAAGCNDFLTKVSSSFKLLLILV